MRFSKHYKRRIVHGRIIGADDKGRTASVTCEVCHGAFSCKHYKKILSYFILFCFDYHFWDRIIDRVVKAAALHSILKELPQGSERLVSTLT